MGVLVRHLFIYLHLKKNERIKEKKILNGLYEINIQKALLFTLYILGYVFQPKFAHSKKLFSII